MRKYRQVGFTDNTTNHYASGYRLENKTEHLLCTFGYYARRFPSSKGLRLPEGYHFKNSAYLPLDVIGIAPVSLSIIQILLIQCKSGQSTMLLKDREAASAIAQSLGATFGVVNDQTIQLYRVKEISVCDLTDLTAEFFRREMS